MLSAIVGKNIIKNEKRRYMNMNASATCLYGTIKLHKQSKPIRPIVNWKNSPAYKIAKYLNKILQDTVGSSEL
jgi:hypothetical protein